MNPASSLFLVRDRPDVPFKVNAAALVAMTITLWAVSGWGVVAIAVAYAVVVVVTSLAWLAVLEKILELDWRVYWTAVHVPAFNAAVTGLAMVGAYFLVDSLVGRPAAVTATVLLVGCAAYAALVALFDRPYVTELRALLRPQRAAGATG